MDAKAFAEHKKKCKRCNRKGLPILLTRYAIAPKDPRVPEIKDAFRVTRTLGGEAAPELGINTVYTNRLLRPGYVYIYDTENLDAKNRKTPWKGYVIDNLGYLTPFPIPTPVGYEMPATHSASEVCDAWANEMLVRCISIDNPEKPRKIWVGYSDTMWTKAVLKEHESERTRDRHMRKFDVGQWWKNVSHEHACKMEACDQHVVEMVKTVPVGLFEFSPAPLNVPRYSRDWEALAKAGNMEISSFPFNNKEKEKKILENMGRVQQQNSGPLLAEASATPKKNLLRAAQRLLGGEQHKAVVLALDDPAGVLMDLAIYTDYTLKRFMTEVIGKKYERHLTLTAIIENMREGMKESILTEAERDANMTDAQLRELWMQTQSRNVGMGAFPIGPSDTAIRMMRETTQERYQKLRDNPDLVQKSADAKWKKYNDKLKPGWEDWKKEHDAEIAHFDQTHVLPLVKAHVSWFKSERYTGYMECNHDPANVESGVSYSIIASSCLGSGQDKELILNEVIIEQLQSRETKKNLVLARALVLNQDVDAKNVDEVQASFEKTPNASDPVVFMGLMKDMLDKAEPSVAALEKRPELLEERKSILDLLTGQVGIAVVHLTQAVASPALMPALLVRLGYINQVPLMRIKVQGNVAEVAEYLAEYYTRLLTKKGLVTAHGGKNGIQVRQNFERMLKKAGRHHADFTAYVAVNEEKLVQELTAHAERSRTGAPSAANRDKALRDNTTISSDRMKTQGGKPFDFKSSMPVKEFEKAQSSGGLMLRNENFSVDEIWDVNRFNEKTGSFVTKKLPAGASILGMCLQLGTLLSASKSVDEAAKKTDEFNLFEAKALYASAFFGTVSAAGDALVGVGTFAPKLVRRAPILFCANSPLIKFGTRGLGIVGGGIAAYMDIVSAEKAKKNEQVGMRILYITSAIAGIGAPIALGLVVFFKGFVAAALTGIGIILLVIGVLVTLAIMFFKDDPLQNWLGRCFFGKDKVDRFFSLDNELAALKAL